MLESYCPLLIYLLTINLVAFIAYAIDKFNAMKNRSRFRNITLIGLALIGGTFGGLLAMYAFRHKTKQRYYTIGIPLIGFMQVAAIFLLILKI